MTTKRQYVLTNAPQGVFKIKDLPAVYACTVKEMALVGFLRRVSRGCYERAVRPARPVRVTLQSLVLNYVPDVGYAPLREILAHFPKHSHPSVRATLQSLMDYGIIHRVDRTYSRGSCPKVSAAADQFLYGGLK